MIYPRVYRKVLPIRPGLDPKSIGINNPFSKKYRKFEKKHNNKYSVNNNN